MEDSETCFKTHAVITSSVKKLNKNDEYLYSNVNNKHLLIKGKT